VVKTLIDIFLASIIISILGLAIASYTDIKGRIIPNNLNIGMALAGLGLFAFYSISVSNIIPFGLSVAGLLWGLIFGWGLWKIGAFAAGDAKLFAALGALNPILLSGFNFWNSNIIFNQSSLPYFIEAIIFFPMVLFFCSILAFMPYGVLITIKKLFEKKEVAKKFVEIISKKILFAIPSILLISGINVLFSSYSFSSILFLIAIVFGLFANKKIAFGVGGIITIVALFVNFNSFLWLGLILFCLSIVVSLLLTLMQLSNELFSKTVLVTKLQEGDIPVFTWVLKNGKAVKLTESPISRIIKYLKSSKINVKDLFSKKFGKAKEFESVFNSKEKIIAYSSRACGLYEEEVRKLKALAKKGLMQKTIELKDSMAFVPTIFLGYLILVYFSSIILKVIIAFLGL
jgi:preflagellin peptidase FlaK